MFHRVSYGNYETKMFGFFLTLRLLGVPAADDDKPVIWTTVYVTRLFRFCFAVSASGFDHVANVTLVSAN